jgi:hypothetical protein
MAGFSAQGATFTFSGSGASFVGAVVGISVETPTAEVVDMTPIDEPSQNVILVPTGSWSGGSVSVDYIATGSQDVQTIVRKSGSLSFLSPRLSITRNAIAESATTEARTGELVRGNIRFRVTDYTGS